MKVGYSREYVRRESLKGLLPVDLVRALDHALGDDGTLLALREQAEAARQALRHSRTSSSWRESVPTTVAGAPTLALDAGNRADSDVAVRAPSAGFRVGRRIRRAGPRIPEPAQ